VVQARRTKFVRAVRCSSERRTASAGSCYTARMEPRFIDDMAARIRALMDQSPAADFEKNVRVLLGRFLDRMDIVSREEYDVQREVLLRTREKLAHLEARVAELERELQRR
jgi:ubiquinone biosynthesis accessory factor UbiK